VRTSDFDYHLPPELIAQRPTADRLASRLLVLHRDTGEIEHRRFPELIEYLRAGDLLVVNETKVIPARLIGRKVGTGGRVEALLLRRRAPDIWQAAVNPGRRLPVGARLEFAERLTGEIISRSPDGTREIRFAGEGDVAALLMRAGEVPLPPYIHTALEDAGRYQTVYARSEGSSAAPTAGMHFTDELLANIEALGVRRAAVTLHIGMATFRPIRADQVEAHDMHREWIDVPAATAQAINDTRAAGGRVIAVGTTVVRALETCADDAGAARAWQGDTDLYITPGHRFRLVDVLLTNFHLPRTTLLVLVCAFAGRDNVLRAYREAIEQRYRFLSFGDAMLTI
jgi:S-adenosylmethionine:tRNA ribosyltransferase-isomerase